MHEIRLIRVYDDLSEWTGIRILVDRLWPRGKKKEDLALDQWAKTVAPSTALRKKFRHDQATFPAFREEYRLELEEACDTDEIQAFLRQVRNDLQQAPVAFLYGAKSREYNHAMVLKEWVEEKLKLNGAGEMK